MAGITWLHLSDLHEGSEKYLKGQNKLNQIGEEYNREKVCKKLIEDITEQRKKSDLKSIDFIVFSGDIAYSGLQEEYNNVEELFTQVFKATGIDPTEKSDHLFIVPGNHDLDRSKFGILAQNIPDRFTNSTEVASILKSKEYRESLLKPFAAYKDFAANLTDIESSDYAIKKEINCKSSGKRVILLGINSALMAGRTINGEVNDYGKLIVGEPQIDDLLDDLGPKKEAGEDEVRIAVLHHPFEWLAEFERETVKNLLMEKCHFILCGHQHVQRIYQVQGLGGEYVIIPAGATYENRKYSNSYNFVHLDFENQKGKIYLRCWSGDKWDRDDQTYPQGEFTFRLPAKKDNFKRLSLSMYSQLVDKLVKQQKRMYIWKDLHMEWQNFGCIFTSHRIALTSMQMRRETDSAYDILKVWPSSSHVKKIKNLLTTLKDMDKSDDLEIREINEIINTDYERMLTDHPSTIESVNINVTNYLGGENENVLNLDNQLNEIEAKITNIKEKNQQIQKREIDKKITELKELKESKISIEKQKQKKLATILSTYLQYIQSIEQKNNTFLKCLDEHLQNSISTFHDLLEDLDNTIKTTKL